MRILGIDLGSISIKAVELESAFGRYEIHDYHEKPIQPGEDPAGALKQFTQGLRKVPDRVAVTLRSSIVTFRNIQLPTRDKKAIDSGVGFELEDELPFALEQAIHDYSILSQNKQAGTYLHVSATLRKHLAAALQIWNSAEIDPDMVTSESWAYRSLLNRMIPPASQEAPLLLAQIGHERTTLYIQWRGTPVISREIEWGGRDLTLAICQKYQIPMGQAEHAKLDRGFVIPSDQLSSASQEQIDFSENLMGPIQSLLWNMRQAELACKTITHQNLSCIYLAGGTSLLPGLGRVIEESLRLPARSLQTLSSVAPSGVAYSEQTDAVFALATAAAICMVGPDRSSSINFRKGEFAKKNKSRDLNLSNLKRPLLAAAAITFCLFTSLFVQSFAYKSKLAEVDAQLEKSIRSFFGQVSSSAVRTYMSNTSTLKGSINKEITKQRELHRLLAPNQKSPVDALKTISASIPPDVVVDMTQFQAGAAEGDPANMTFLAHQPQFTEKLSMILGTKLTGLQSSKVEEVPAQEGVGKRWRVTFTGKPAEGLYGN